MPDDYLPKKKGDLNAWTTNFISVATANVTTLGFSTGDIATLNSNQAAYNTALNSVETAKGMLKAAVQAEKTATKTMTNTIRTDVRRIQINPAATPALKGQLRINPRTAPKNHTPPITPTGLMVEGFATGVNSLKWDRAGNKPDTIFEIHAKIGESANFAGVGAVTATKFDHVRQTPGVKVVYRVVALRAGRSSEPSTGATVYEDGATGFFTQQKAA